MPSASRMNLSIPTDIRRLVTQAALSTAAAERAGLDDSAWIVRAVCEKLQREWQSLGTGRPMPELVRALSRRGLAGTAEPVAGSAAAAAS
jgi:hypothetical protein